MCRRQSARPWWLAVEAGRGVVGTHRVPFALSLVFTSLHPGSSCARQGVCYKVARCYIASTRDTRLATQTRRPFCRALASHRGTRAAMQPRKGSHADAFGEHTYTHTSHTGGTATATALASSTGGGPVQHESSSTAPPQGAQELAATGSRVHASTRACRHPPDCRRVPTTTWCACRAGAVPAL